MITGRDNQTMLDATKFTPPLQVVLNSALGPMGIIRAQGADAIKFLQGQLTQDVALLGLSEARLAAWCSAKGRMSASFVVLKNTHEDILLLCSASVLPATLKRLQMFVLRAQCKLSDATALFTVHGLAGDAAAAFAPSGSSIWSLGRINDKIYVQLPSGVHLGSQVPRALCIEATVGDSAVAPDTARQGDDTAHQLEHWQYLEVSTGIATITAPIVDAFVPQMLNYESVGGVNFKKGCYPGQEVVARSQFRGTLKRRAYVISSDAPLAAGQEVFDNRAPEQPCGLVASAAPQPGTSHWLAVVSMQTSAADSPGLSVLSVDGPALQMQTLPYALLDDI
jgi:tRNA-modifying protein YgfZ